MGFVCYTAGLALLPVWEWFGVSGADYGLGSGLKAACLLNAWLL